MPFKRLFLAVFVCIFTLNGFSQSKNTEKADEEYRAEAYLQALEEYKDAYQKESSNTVKAYIVYQIAECFRKINDTENAKTWYKRSIQLKHNNPKQYLYLGMALMEDGNYTEAQKNIKDYLSQTTGDKVAKNLLEACQNADSWLNNPTKWVVKEEKALNSVEHDFAPAFADKRNTVVMFTSGRKGSSGDNLDDRIGENFQDLWSAEKDRKGDWSTPALFNPEINTEDAHEGSAVMNYKRNKIYFTQCKVDKKDKLGCNIVSGDIIGPNIKNFVTYTEFKMEKGDSISIGHPAISKKEDILVFSSDLPGGIGGKDLWMVSYDKKERKWGSPKNLGPKINTSADEVYPFIHPEGDLYYSSNGMVGLGGLDIYKAKQITDGRWDTPENMKAPINSPKDDFSLYFNKSDNEGYFTSNRKGGTGKDDIYSFYLPPPKIVLEGVVFDKDTRQPVSNATVTVKNSYGNTFSLTTNSQGYYKFDENGSRRYIDLERDYLVEVTKQDYLLGRDQFDTKGISDDKTYSRNFTIQYASPNKPIAMPEVQYALNSYELKPNSKDSLNYLYKILTENTNIVIELQAHTDSRGDSTANSTLSQKRAESCINYLIEKGIPKERMIPKGYGEQKLKISDAEIAKLPTEDAKERAHQKNRRTEFAVIKTDYTGQ